MTSKSVAPGNRQPTVKLLNTPLRISCTISGRSWWAS